MTWMNEWEIDDAMERWMLHPVLGPAVRTLSSLRDAANRNSDGWHIWPKPARAGDRLMTMIHAASWCEGDSRYVEPTEAALRSALSPVKAFRTRMISQHGEGWDFTITERMPTKREQLSAELMDAERGARDHAALADRYLASAQEIAAELAELDDTPVAAG